MATHRDPEIEEAVLDMISQDRTEAEQRAWEAELEAERLRAALEHIAVTYTCQASTYAKQVLR